MTNAVFRNLILVRTLGEKIMAAKKMAFIGRGARGALFPLSYNLNVKHKAKLKESGDWKIGKNCRGYADPAV